MVLAIVNKSVPRRPVDACTVAESQLELEPEQELELG